MTRGCNIPDCPVLNDPDFTPGGELTVIEGAA